MNKTIIALVAVASLSSFANDCKIKPINNSIEKYKLDVKQKIDKRLNGFFSENSEDISKVLSERESFLGEWITDSQSNETLRDTCKLDQRLKDKLRVELYQTTAIDTQHQSQKIQGLVEKFKRHYSYIYTNMDEAEEMVQSCYAKNNKAFDLTTELIKSSTNCK